jgi:predicted nuclease of predicted toxin-antitoxin system
MTAPETRDMYVCDADCLINLHRHFGRKALAELRRLGRNGALKLPEGVIRELIRGTDHLASFAEKHQKLLEVAISTNARLQREVATLEKKYGERIVFGQQSYAGFWRSKAGRRAADGQVVAAAKSEQAMAVSDDQAVKLACALENVPCIGWSEFARRLGLITAQQLQLNLGDAGGGA